MTKQQQFFASWCDSIRLNYEFTSESSVTTWWRVSGKWRIGEQFYTLYGNAWKMSRNSHATVIREDTDNDTN